MSIRQRSYLFHWIVSLRMKPMFRLVLWISIALHFVIPTSFSHAQDPSWSTINATGNPSERHENGFVAYNGKLYLIGGRSPKPVQIYDPDTNSWSDGASPGFQMHHFQAVVYNDLIYVIGAYTGVCCDGESGISHVWTYNPQTNQWNQSHEIPSNRRRGSTGAVVHNNKIYIIGGIEGGHGSAATPYDWFDEYDPATGEWRVMPNAPRVRDHFHAVLYNNKIYLTGGRDTSDPSFVNKTISEIDVYDFGTGNWSTLSTTLPTPRGGTSSILYRGEILVIGGESNSQELAHNATEALNPNTQTWNTLSTLNVGRHGTQATILNDAVYIAAGAAQRGGTPELDSIEKYEDTSTGLSFFTQSLKRNWNLLSLPFSMSEDFYLSIYNSVDLDGISPYTWSGSNYVPSSNLASGTAFWLKLSGNPGSVIQNFEGTPVDQVQFSLDQGWNMIASPSCNNVSISSSSTSPSGAIAEGLTYHYQTGGYQPAFNFSNPRGVLNQGKGYWVFANTNATLTLTCGSGKQPHGEQLTLEDVSRTFGQFTIRDTDSGKQSLFFGNSLKKPEQRLSYQLPPQGPRGEFDARFTDDSRLTELSNAVVRINGTFPITFTYDKSPENKEGYLFVDEVSQAGDILHTNQLTPTEHIQLYDTDIAYLRVRFEETLADHPTQFALHGNYPNPFNPTTRITFDAPQRGDLTLRVVDILGREVHHAAYTGIEASSNQSISFDAKDLPAGIYIYALTLETENQIFSQSGRMTVLK